MTDHDQEPLHCEVMESSAIEAQERASVDIQIATARRYGRDLATVKRDMLSLATLDQETAESCFYTLRRKDNTAPGGYKVIQGPSARMAEIAANSFQHISAVTRTVGNDGKMITVQAVCHDLYRNVRIGTEVKRRITTKSGHTFSEDMQVVTTNAAQSIALRNAIFKVIPMALIKPVYEAAKKVAVGNESTLAKRRESIVKRLEEMGAKRDRIFAVLEVTGMESIGLEQIEILIGIGTAIKEGDTSVNEAFPEVTDTPADFGDDKKAEKKPAETKATGPLVDLLALMKKDEITEEQTLTYFRALGVIEDETLKSLNEVAMVAPGAIVAMKQAWKAAAKEIKKAASQPTQ